SASKAKTKSAAPKKKKTASAGKALAGSATPGTAAPTADAISAHVKALAAQIEQEVRSGNAETVLEPEALQAMLTALCRVYSAHIEAGNAYEAFSERNPLTPTDVMVTASGLLKAANLAVFELGMWQSWTGR